MKLFQTSMTSSIFSYDFFHSILAHSLTFLESWHIIFGCHSFCFCTPLHYVLLQTLHLSSVWCISDLIYMYPMNTTWKHRSCTMVLCITLPSAAPSSKYYIAPYLSKQVRKVLRTRKAPACLLILYMCTVSPDCRLCTNIHHYTPPRPRSTAADRCRGRCTTSIAPGVY